MPSLYPEVRERENRFLQVVLCYPHVHHGERKRERGREVGRERQRWRGRGKEE